MEVKAHAKINLCLNVVGKREDGYHELEMIMVPLTLHDVIQIELAQEDQYTCSDPSLKVDEHNTVVKAVRLLRETFAFKERFHIHIEKHIPAQAGLAGGSADGAAVLRGIVEALHLPINLADLAMLGKKIGADVPFCVYQTCSVVKGIGEIVEPFAFDCPYHIVLVKPNMGISTPVAFSQLDFQACDHPDCEKVKQCLVSNTWDLVPELLKNSLEYSAFTMVPMIKTMKQELRDMGCFVSLMSGSGSTVFALTKDKTLADDIVEIYQKRGLFSCRTEILTTNN